MKKSIIQFAVLSFVLLISTETNAQKVLFVLSAEDTLMLNNGKKERQTGVFLNEFYMAYEAIVSEGYQVTFATPNGIKATIDEESLDDRYWKENSITKEIAIELWDNNKNFSQPITLEEALDRSDEFIGLVIPGGQGLMVDLYYDHNIPILLRTFSDHSKAIGLVCHAPALLTTFEIQDNPFVGYTVNSVTPLEERYIELFIMRGKPDNRKIARQLKKSGLNYVRGRPGRSYATRDRNLVTSQNPFSGDRFNDLFLELLDEINLNNQFQTGKSNLR